MLILALAISCLTTSNLPWFMDLPFQVPMQYCSLQHLTLPLSPVSSTTVCCFCFGSIPSFFLELFLHWFPVAYWASTDMGSSSFSVLSFCLFILFMGFSRQKYWSGFPFASPVDHILSELSTMTHLSWVALYSMAHSFIELDKANVKFKVKFLIIPQAIAYVFFIYPSITQYSVSQDTPYQWHTTKQQILICHRIIVGLHIHHKGIMMESACFPDPASATFTWLASRKLTCMNCPKNPLPSELPSAQSTDCSAHQWASDVALMVKTLPASAGRHKRHRFNSWVRKAPCRRAWQPTSVFFPEESQGQTEKPGGLHSKGSQKVGHDWRDLACTHARCQLSFCDPWSKVAAPVNQQTSQSCLSEFES